MTLHCICLLLTQSGHSSQGFVGNPSAGSTPAHVLETPDGKTGSHRVLRARAGSRPCRRGRPVLQEPVLGTADGERRNSPGVRSVLSEVPEALRSAAKPLTGGDVRFWPKADVSLCAAHVRFWG